MGERDIHLHYELGLEQSRLSPGSDPRLEYVRTMELLERFLPPAPAAILDVGGGPGTYAVPLARAGYRVRLVDLVSLHVEQALEAGIDAAIGDARALDEQDASFDAVLLLGPLYHLTEREDRVLALQEARRVVRPDGVVLAVGISRFASVLDGLATGALAEPEFRTIVERDLEDGRHVNPEPVRRPEWFTTAFFHHPDELRAEGAEAGLDVDALLGIEGAGWLLEDRWGDPSAREQMLYAARALEGDASLSGLSAHMLLVGRRT